MQPLTRFATALAFYLALLMVWNGVHAQPTDENDRSVLQRWAVSLDWIELELDENEVKKADFKRYEERLGALIDDVEKFKAGATEDLKAPRQELDALGPKPEDGELAEAGDISEQRGAINKRITALTQQEKQAGLMIVRAEQLLERLSKTQGKRLETRLKTRTSAIYSSTFWSKVGVDATQLSVALINDARELLNGQRRDSWAGWILLILVTAAALITVPCARWLTRRFGRQPQANNPTYTQRTLSAFVEGVASGLLPAAIIGGIGITLVKQELVGEQAMTLVSAVTVSTVLAVVAAAPIRAAFVPHAPTWRLLPIDSVVAARLTRRIQCLVAFCAIMLALYMASEHYRPYTAELDVLSKLVVAVTVGSLLMSLLHHRVWQPGTIEPDETRPSPPLGALRRTLMGVVASAVAVGLLSYVELSAFLVSRIAITLLTIGALLLIRRLLRELLDRLIRAWHQFTRIERESSASPLGFWLGGLLDFLLLGLALLISGSAWGIPQTAIYLWSRRLLDGVTIGELTLSPGRFLLAAFVFSVVFVATRLLRRITYDRVLPETRMDFGLRHSIYVGMGYIGLALATILAIVTLGLELNNLALVFGALSVGIGLGLQGVVSNFMSGLILLVQRPIRVGDWIEVGGHEGIVRNIMSVSTEIETFDNASIIIPNSDLVSQSLVNWTHTDRTVRVTVCIGVAYGSNIEHVQQLLLDCASRHDEVLTTPRPYALFVDFGESALQFELRFFVHDAERYHIVSSELRFIVDEACRKADIEIPYPQRHVHINSVTKNELPPSTSSD